MSACIAAAARTARLLPSLLVLAVVSAGCGTKDEPKEATRSEISQVVQELDETVWKDEVAAQDHERFFIELWDGLRASKDWHGLLSKVELEAFNVAAAASPKDLPARSEKEFWPGVFTQRGGENIRSIVFFGELLRLRQAGWRLEQSEWHHQSFRPAVDENTSARSEVHVVLHAQKEQERRIVDATIEVDWHAEPAPSGLRRPRSVTVRDWTQHRSKQVLQPRSFPLDVRTRGSGSVVVEPVVVTDINGDGFNEIIAVGINKILWNRAGVSFDLDVFTREPVHEPGPAAVVADFTGDAQPDLVLVDGHGTLQLFAGEKQAGEPPYTPYTTPPKNVWPGGGAPQVSAITAGDIDGDNDLDLYIAQYKEPYLDGNMPQPFFDAKDGFPGYLLLNDGAGRFTDVSDQIAFGDKRNRRVLSSSFIDFDTDGDQDLVLLCDFSGIDLYENDGTGQFKDATAERIDERAMFGMAHAFADFNHDGRPDLFAIGMSSTTVRRLEGLNASRDDASRLAAVSKARVPMTYGNRLYLWDKSSGGWRQDERSQDVARSGWAWGTAITDFNNDGEHDIYVCNGQYSGESCKDYCTRYWRHDVYLAEEYTANSLVDFLKDSPLRQLENRAISWNGFEHNHLYIGRPATGSGNDSEPAFANLSWLYGLAFETDHRSVVVDDLNNNGAVDFVLTDILWNDTIKTGRQRLITHLNPLKTNQHWIGVRLVSRVPGRSPVGSRIEVEAGGRTHTKFVVTGESFRVQGPFGAHVGLGSVDKVERIRVHWSDGTVQSIDQPAIDKHHLILAAE